MSRHRLIAVALALVLTGVLLFAWRVWPWLAGPPASAEEVAASWRVVETLATPGAASAASPATLQTALEHLAGSKTEPGKNWDPERPTDGLDLDAGALRALEALVAWAEEGGGLGPDPCIVDPTRPHEGMQAFALFSLARLAIRASRGPDDPTLKAAMRLGSQVRQRGTLIYAVIGFQIAEDALAVTRARGDAATDLFVAQAPTREEVLPVFAREAVCTVRMAEQVFAAEGMGDVDASQGRVARLTARWVGPDRELAMARWFFGEAIGRAAGAPRDLAAVAEALRHPPPEELPASLLVRVLAFDLSPRVEDMGETIAAYEEFVAAAPAGR